MRTIGWPACRIVSTIAPIPPESSRPNRLSASSRITSFRPPAAVVRNSPASVNVCVIAPRRATFRTASAFRLSEAFISTTAQPMSFARARAALVLPVPGGPARITARFSGDPFSHDVAHFWSSETAVGFPITSLREFGRYFSVQVDIGPGYRTPALKGTGRVAESGEKADFMSDLYLFT